jgi:hypothetical protein
MDGQRFLLQQERLRVEERRNERRVREDERVREGKRAIYIPEYKSETKPGLNKLISALCNLPGPLRPVPDLISCDCTPVYALPDP